MLDKFEHDLWAEYVLNEIKTREDTLKQLLTVNVLLIGAYCTLIFNFFINIVAEFHDKNGDFYFPILSKYPFLPSSIWNSVSVALIILILLSPILFWYLSIRVIINVFKIKEYKDYSLPQDEHVSTLLSNIIFDLDKALTLSCHQMMGGLGMFIVLIICCSLIIGIYL